MNKIKIQFRRQENIFIYRFLPKIFVSNMYKNILLSGDAGLPKSFFTSFTLSWCPLIDKFLRTFPSLHILNTHLILFNTLTVYPFLK